MTARPTVVHVVWEMNYGGIETLVRELCQWQSAHGAEPAIIETGPATGQMAAELRTLGLAVYQCPLNPKRSFVSRLSTLLRTIKPLAVHHHCFGTAFLAAFAARLAGVPCTVETAHSLNAYSLRTWREKRRVWIGCLFSRLITHRVAVSHAVRECMPLRKRVRVVYNGVDCERFGRPRDNRLLSVWGITRPAETIVVGHIGSFREVKNHGAMLRIAADVKRRSGRPIAFVCAGDGERFSKIGAEVHARGLERSVLLLGIYQNIPEFLGCCDLFFMPSKYEGLPMACIEAMAASVVPVVSDVAGLSEVVCDDTVGRKFPLDKENLAVEAILELAESAELRRQLGVSARERASSVFSLDACGRAYNQLYGLR
jgi:glycosyltransferase involved in cell wall biosynthesis